MKLPNIKAHELSESAPLALIEIGANHLHEFTPTNEERFRQLEKLGLIFLARDGDPGKSSGWRFTGRGLTMWRILIGTSQVLAKNRREELWQDRHHRAMCRMSDKMQKATNP